MVNSKNSLNLNPKKTTFQKSISLSKHVDSLPKKEFICDKKDLRIKSLPAISGNKIKDSISENIIEKQVIESSVDDNRRLFLKVAGVAGLGLAASALFPKGADAYVSGSTPTSNVVGMRNIANTKINPATEDGNLATIANNTTSIAAEDFATQATLANVKTNTDNLSGIKTGTDNLSGIKINTDKFKFDGDNLLISGGASDSGYEIVGLKDLNSNRVNPATDDAVVLLRRMVKLMESQATVDGATRQRITVDSLGALGAAMPVSGTLTSAGTVSTVTTVSSITNMVTLAGQNQQMYQDPARNAYANGIRQNLSFT